MLQNEQSHGAFHEIYFATSSFILAAYWMSEGREAIISGLTEAMRQQ